MDVTGIAIFRPHPLAPALAEFNIFKHVESRSLAEKKVITGYLY
jgi:hypothetical protein